MLTVTCSEPEGDVIRQVWPFAYTAAGLKRLYEKCSQFPVLFAKPLTGMKDFLNIMIHENLSGDPQPACLIWILDDYVGMFTMDNITESEASVHYSFFDRRHKGREAVVVAMLKHVFATYGFNRVNVEIPAYAGMGPRLFIERCGFRLEGCKRKAWFWKNNLFSVYSYGILKEEVWALKQDK